MGGGRLTKSIRAIISDGSLSPNKRLKWQSAMDFWIMRRSC